MSTQVALIGAGGKMGARITNNLQGDQSWQTSYCETAPAAVETLRAKGIVVAQASEAVPEADYILLAVPDRAIMAVSKSIVPLAKSGATVLLLDPAAAMAEEVEIRPDLTYIVTHPCHPPLFGEQPSSEARKDFFGGVAAWQDIVIALMRGEESKFSTAVELCKAIFRPVRTAHRITVEQMAILEPAMAEVVAASAAVLMKEALEETVRRGVPRAAAESFMMGHAQIPLAIAFGAIKSPFSDAAKIAIQWGTERIIQPNWRNVFEPEQVRAAITCMLHPEEHA